LTPVFPFSFHDGPGTRFLDDRIDGAVVVCNEEDGRIVGSRLEDLPDHSLGRDHRHSPSHTIRLSLVDGQTLKPGGGVLSDHFSGDRRTRKGLTKLKEFPEPLIGEKRLFFHVVFFLKVDNPMFQHLVLPLEVNQEEILLVGVLKGLNREGGGPLEGRAEFHDEGINKGNPLLLFYPQRHQDQGHEQKEDDQGWNRIAS